MFFKASSNYLSQLPQGIVERDRIHGTVYFLSRADDSTCLKSLLRPFLLPANDADYRTPSPVGEPKFPTYSTRFLLYCTLVGFFRSVRTIAAPRLDSTLLKFPQLLPPRVSRCREDFRQQCENRVERGKSRRCNMHTFEMSDG